MRWMTFRRVATALLALAGVPVLPVCAGAAELQPRTSAAFERYVRATEARIETEVRDADRFLWVATLPAPARAAKVDVLSRGGLVIERVVTMDHGRPIEIPDGLVHHWVGLAFLPGVRLERAVALLQAYERHDVIYQPRIARSALLESDGDRFRFHLRFLMTKVITVVIDSEHEARFVRPGPDRAYSRIVSTRMAEVEHPGTAEERQKPVGRDGGYLWRLNSYWRFLERDGGTYLQCESISLTRGIPIGLGWVVGPFVTSLPRESLEFTLDTTRRALLPSQK
jgi:hypothetical protein